jgi:signal transduction histidine kinase
MQDLLSAGKPHGRVRLRLRRSQLWVRFVVAGAAAGLVYLLLPAPVRVPAAVARLLLYNGVGAAAAAAVVVGVRRYQPRDQLPWWLLAAGQVIYLAGNVTFCVAHNVLHRTIPYPSAADAIDLAHYPFMVAGVLLLVRRRTPEGDRGALIDGSIVAIGMGVLSWTFLIEPPVAASGMPWASRLVSAAYPVMDVLVLAVAARLLMWPGSRPPAFRLLAGGLAALLLADTLYLWLQLHGGYHSDILSGRLAQGGWVSFSLLLGAAALHPSMRLLTEPAPGRRHTLSRGRLAFLGGVSLLTPALILSQDVFTENPFAVLVLLVFACVALFLLVIARMAGLFHAVETARAELQLAFENLEQAEEERRQLLDRTVRSAEEERKRIAAELHDGPIQRLTAVGYRLDEAVLTMELGDTTGALELLGSTHRWLSREINELRRMMTRLRPPVLDERGLARALLERLDALQTRNGIACAFEGDAGVRVDQEAETVLYRVVQEALTNIAKHAGARHAWVRLGAIEGRVELQVRDDGVGFDTGQLAALVKSGHFGLAGMRERVEMAGGSYQLSSDPGIGTTITVQLPRQLGGE